MNSAARSLIRQRHIKVTSDSGECIHCGCYSDEHGFTGDENGNIVAWPCLDKNLNHLGTYLTFIPDEWCGYCAEVNDCEPWPCETIMILDALEQLLTNCDHLIPDSITGIPTPANEWGHIFCPKCGVKL